ncbi:MAG: YibE/F family protein [Minisyncoccia bacterium]
METINHNNHIRKEDKPNKYIVLLILFLSLAGMFFAFKGPVSDDIIKGVVIEVESEQDIALELGEKSKTIKEQTLRVEIITNGEKRDVTILNDYNPVKIGDEIFLRGALFGENELTIADISRTKGLIWLLILFVLLVLAIGGRKGIYALIGLLFTFAVIFVFLVPQILTGASPVSIGIISAAVILIPTLYLSYGVNKKSIAAFLGIIFSLLVVGVAANYLVDILHFTGLSETSVYLDMESLGPINLLGLMVAGIIIAAVGVLDDVAVIQASVVWSLAEANPEFRGVKLFREAMRVGKDHISAVVNTLVLAYTGASLPLLLLLSLQRMSPSYFASTEVVAEEILRTLVSSSGLLLAVPLTTLIATLMIRRNNSK